MDLTRLPVGPEPPHIVHAVIEIPRGDRNKYEYDPKLGMFRLDRVLYSAVHYPAAYGFIPGTLAADGDPVDILVLTSEATFTGCLLEARPIGLLRMQDEKGEDEKILAAATVDPHYRDLRELVDVPAHFLHEVEHFFRIYKDLEGKPVETFGWEGHQTATWIIRKSIHNAT